MFLEVIKAEYVKDYEISLSFNNGENKIIDFKNILVGHVFEPLKELEKFKKFEIKFNTIEWENGADFAPEYLYELPSEIN